MLQRYYLFITIYIGIQEKQIVDHQRLLRFLLSKQFKRENGTVEISSFLSLSLPLLSWFGIKEQTGGYEYEVHYLYHYYST